MTSDAVLSDDNLYRYVLVRSWAEPLPVLVVCMLNPSKADALRNDPTVTKLIGFAKRGGYGGLFVVNLYAWRATNPKELRAHPRTDCIGPQNDQYIEKAALLSGSVVCAWGVGGGLHGRDRTVLARFKELGVATLCWGTTQDGHPRHPLYLANDTELVLFHGLKPVAAPTTAPIVQTTRRKLGTWLRKHAVTKSDFGDLFDRQSEQVTPSYAFCRGTVEVFAETPKQALYRCTRCSSADANGRIDLDAILESPDFTPAQVPHGR